jgi:hypothetical protein
MLVLYLSFAGITATHMRGNLDPSGAPLGYDFSAYYEAAQFARAGRAAEAYDDARMIAAERARFPGVSTRLPWNYPPVFLLFLLPFTALPYAAAWALWTVLMLGAFAALAWHLVPRRALWPVLLFPGAVINLFLGANGLLSALLLGGGVALIPRRPYAAGMILGCAIYKPHLALLVPLVLLAGRNLRTLAAMLGTAAALMLLSALAFGGDSWTAFLAKAAQASSIASTSSSDWRNVPTLLVLMKTLGAGEAAALCVHAAFGLAAALAAAWIWRRTDDPVHRMSALMLGTLLLTPYARIYDLALLMVPIAFAVGGKRRPGEQPVIACAWIAPLAGLFLGALIPWLCLISIMLLGLVLKRVQDETQPMFSARS